MSCLPLSQRQESAWIVKKNKNKINNNLRQNWIPPTDIPIEPKVITGVYTIPKSNPLPPRSEWRRGLPT